MPAAQVSGTRRRHASRVLAVLGLALAFAALGSGGSASADSTNPATTTTLTISPVAANLGDPVTMTATVTGVGGNPPGTVLFANAGTPIGSVPLTPVAGSTTTSQAVLVTTSLAAGTYAVTANYNSSNFGNFSSSVSLPVSLSVSGVTIFNTTTTLSASPPTVASGQPLTLTAQVARVGDPGIPTGIVTFTDNGVFIGQQTLDATGTVTLTRSDFPTGSHTFNADYSGDTFDRSSGAAITLDVTGGPSAVTTTTTVTATPNQIVAGAPVSLTAHVVQTGTGTPVPVGGLVSFRTVGTNGAFLGEAAIDANGNATISVGGWIPGQYVIEADYEGDTGDLPSRGTVTIGVFAPGADLALTATATPATAHTGGQITYSLVVVNGGLDTAQSVVLTDQLPAGTTFVSAAPGSPTCTVASGQLTCALGTMANGAQQTVTLVVAVGPGLAGTTIADNAQVTSTTADANAANNSATVSTPVRASADLQLTQTGPVSVAAGGSLGYTITVKNAGPDAAAAVALSDTLPPGLTGASATTTAGSCAIATGQLSCLLGAIANGGTVTVTVAATLSAGTTATSISNTASVTSSTDDPNAANNSATVVTSVTQSPVCTAVGSVYANQDFKQTVGRKTQTVHVEATADCDRDWRTGRIVLHYASLLVTIDGRVLIDADQADMTQVSIIGPHDAIMRGTYAGTPFTVTLHDGNCASGNDSVRVQYGSLDTSTLTAKHGNVQIDNR
jgi:uncharacterized repeat protein (TIGR01451 family)